MFDSYILLNRKPTKIIKIFTFSIMLSFIVLVSLSYKLVYTPYLNNTSYVVDIDNNYYIKMKASYKELNLITVKDKVIIDDKKYNYKIYKIDPKLIDNKFQFVYLKVDKLPHSYKFNNYSLLVKIPKDKKRFIDVLKEGEL